MKIFYKVIAGIVLCAFTLTTLAPNSYAAELMLPAPTQMLKASTAAFTPAIVKGMVLHADDPFKFDFLMDTGTDKLSGEALKQEAERTIKYFLASLTVDDRDQWVNLSPDEKDRVIPQAFGKTAMGRDLLAQDYVLKQLASSLLYPEKGIGKEFWARVYSQAKDKLGITDIDVKNFNRVWIAPAEAQVWENDGKVVIIKSRLKVMLETDYLAASAQVSTQSPTEQVNNIMREILIPALEKEVNEGAHFAQLRQIYASMILAAWYKDRLKESVLARAYAGRAKVAGVEFSGTVDKQKIYSEYLQAVKKGVYNYVREDVDASTGESVPRKYFSGGFSTGNFFRSLALAGTLAVTGALGALPGDTQALAAQAAQPSGEMVIISSGAVEMKSPEEYLLSAMELARSDDVEKRFTAVWRLGQIGDPRAVPVLKEALKDKHMKVVRAAISALTKTGDVAAIDALFSMLGDPNDTLRRDAAKSLAFIIQEQDGLAILRRHLAAKDEQELHIVKTRLKELGIGWFDRTTNQERGEMLAAVGALIGIVTLVHYKKKRRNERSEENDKAQASPVRQAVRLAYKAAGFYWLEKKFLNSKDANDRYLALSRIIRFQNVNDAGLITSMVLDEKKVIRILAWSGLKKLERRDLLARAAVTALSSPLEEVRQEGVDFFARSGNKAMDMPLLVQLYSSSRPVEWQWAEKAMIGMGVSREEIRQAVENYFRGARQEDRKMARFMLEHMSGKSGRWIAAAFLRSANASDRRAAVAYFIKYNNNSALGYISRLITDEDRIVRYYARSAMAGLGVPHRTIIRANVAALQAGNPDVQQDALDYLMAVVTKDDLQQLAEYLLSDNRPFTRKIEQLMGQVASGSEIKQALNAVFQSGRQQMPEAVREAAGDKAQANNLGGIDMDRGKLDLRVTRSGRAVWWAGYSQNIVNLEVAGLRPVIYRIEPVSPVALLMDAK